MIFNQGHDPRSFIYIKRKNKQEKKIGLNHSVTSDTVKGLNIFKGFIKNLPWKRDFSDYQVIGGQLTIRKKQINYKKQKESTTIKSL